MFFFVAKPVYVGFHELVAIQIGFVSNDDHGNFFPIEDAAHIFHIFLDVLEGTMARLVKHEEEGVGVFVIIISQVTGLFLPVGAPDIELDGLSVLGADRDGNDVVGAGGLVPHIHKSSLLQVLDPRRFPNAFIADDD